ncbi:hypothetical protein [Burkholderia pseudomallei]|uniref:Uncharacterized protein n=1 Tax=Burkholderia pseudomallei TaxID=28450 RepID=A0A0C5B4J5_BURPE|nr:hypothetical protein [Burkholderia pseudomallei]AJL34966.1 hypothetical protein pBPS083 [Burkholderia pseudomallei]
MKKPITQIVLAMLVSTPVFALPSTNGVAFTAHGPYVSGAAVIDSPQGGDYVYSNRDIDDGRRPQRFMLGKAPRQNYDLFSEKEEAALWNTREAMSAPKRATLSRRTGHHAKRHGGSALNWPKVIVMGEKTCVPSSEFAASADWQKHLVCWDRGARRVD